MTTPTSSSISAHLIETLVSWRNNEPKGIPKKITSEIGFALISVVATIETIISAIFTGLSTPLSLITEQPFKRSTKWAQSASFTVIWALTNLITHISNPNQNLATTTSLAYQNLFPKSSSAIGGSFT